jgi:hypothetical protein
MKRRFAALALSIAGPLFFPGPLVLVGSPGALAQVPTADVAREAKETQTAGCTTRAAAANAATVQPSQGVKGSLVAPSAAAPSATVGAASVTGLPSAGATAITNSGLGTFAGSTVSGVNLSALTSAGAGAGAVLTLGQSSVATVGQAIGALSGLAAALQMNGPALNGAGAAIGGVNAAQGAWNQNTSARIGAASVWGQAIQTATMALQLRNLILLQQTARASGQASVMTYDATKAALVTATPAATIPSTTSLYFTPTTTK